MAKIDVNIEKTIRASQDIMESATKTEELKNRLENVKLSGVIDGDSGARIEQSIKKILDEISDEAVKMKSLGEALAKIAEKYKETENALISSMGEADLKGMEEAAVIAEGTDKRNWWNKFWDWLTNKEPDKYDTTTREQEKAADEAMKKKLWKVLQDEKYSQENWDNASVEERKQILQDYMNEVIKIYGLQDVKAEIVWDNNATYTEKSITWGSYNHGSHTVKLNARALTDSVGNWDSYELLGTVSHELRHAYQHEAVDHPTDYMVSQETIDKWEYNLKPENYISSSEDYTKYRQQTVEVDARDFEVSRNDRRYSDEWINTNNRFLWR